MWTTTSLKCPEEEDRLAVVRVTPDGDATLVAYLSDPPEHVEQEFAAIQQRWTYRATWPRDAEIQRGAQIEEYYKYAEDRP